MSELDSRICEVAATNHAKALKSLCRTASSWGKTSDLGKCSIFWKILLIFDSLFATIIPDSYNEIEAHIQAALAFTPEEKFNIARLSQDCMICESSLHT